MADEAVPSPLLNGVRRIVSLSRHDHPCETCKLDSQPKNRPEPATSDMPCSDVKGHKYFYKVDVNDLQCHGIWNAQYYELVYDRSKAEFFESIDLYFGI